MRGARSASLALLVASGLVIGSLLLHRPGRGGQREHVRAAAPAASPPTAISPAAQERSATRRTVPSLSDRGGLYTAPVGTALSFTLETRQETRIKLGADRLAAADLVLSTSGELELAVIGRDEEEILIALSFPKTRVEMNAAGRTADAEGGSPTAELESELARTALVRLRHDGSVLAWRFPAETGPLGRQTVQGLFALLRFVVPMGTPTSWTGEERDTTGRWQVDYMRLEERSGRVPVVRRRTSCELLSLRQMEPISRVQDEGRAEFDREIGWLVEADCSATLSVEAAGAGIALEARTTATLRLASASRVSSVPDLARSDGSWEEEGSVAVAGLDPEREQLRRDEAAVSGTSLERIVADLETILAVHGLGSEELFLQRELLKSCLRCRPETLEALEALISDGSLSLDAIGVALSAIGATRGAPAQLMLCRVAADGAGDPLTRRHALLALFQVATPVPEAVSAIESQWLDPDVPRDLRSTALLLLGTYARGSPERASSLVEWRGRAEADRMLESYVAALGNAHLYTVVETFLQDTDPRVRSAAAQILRWR